MYFFFFSVCLFVFFFCFGGNGRDDKSTVVGIARLPLASILLSDRLSLSTPLDVVPGNGALQVTVSLGESPAHDMMSPSRSLPRSPQRVSQVWCVCVQSV